MIANGLLEKKVNAPFGVDYAAGDARAVKFSTELNYETVELINVIAHKSNLTHSQVISEAIKFFFESNSDAFSGKISAEINGDANASEGENYE